MKLFNQKGFMSALGLLMAMAIMFFIGYLAYGRYLNKRPGSADNQKALSDYNPNDSQLGIFQDMKQKIADVNQKTKERADQFPNE